MIENDKKETLRRLFRMVKIEREIYHDVFNSDVSWKGALPSGELVDFCHKRLKDAERDFAIERRREDIIKCKRCGEEGIGIDDEKIDDDKLFEIFARQDDSDSQYANEYLCDECMGIDDNYFANKENKWGG